MLGRCFFWCEFVGKAKRCTNYACSLARSAKPQSRISGETVELARGTHCGRCPGSRVFAANGGKRQSRESLNGGSHNKFTHVPNTYTLPNPMICCVRNRVGGAHITWCMHKAMHTQGGAHHTHAHKRWSIATAGVILSNGACGGWPRMEHSEPERRQGWRLHVEHRQVSN